MSSLEDVLARCVSKLDSLISTSDQYRESYNELVQRLSLPIDNSSDHLTNLWKWLPKLVPDSDVQVALYAGTVLIMIVSVSELALEFNEDMTTGCFNAFRDGLTGNKTMRVLCLKGLCKQEFPESALKPHVVDLCKSIAPCLESEDPIERAQACVALEKLVTRCPYRIRESEVKWLPGLFQSLLDVDMSVRDASLATMQSIVRFMLPISLQVATKIWQLSLGKVRDRLDQMLSGDESSKQHVARCWGFVIVLQGYYLSHEKQQVRQNIELYINRVAQSLMSRQNVDQVCWEFILSHLRFVMYAPNKCRFRRSYKMFLEILQRPFQLPDSTYKESLCRASFVSWTYLVDMIGNTIKEGQNTIWPYIQMCFTRASGSLRDDVSLYARQLVFPISYKNPDQPLAGGEIQTVEYKHQERLERLQSNDVVAPLGYISTKQLMDDHVIQLATLQFMAYGDHNLPSNSSIWVALFIRAIWEAEDTLIQAIVKYIRQLPVKMKDEEGSIDPQVAKEVNHIISSLIKATQDPAYRSGAENKQSAGQSAIIWKKLLYVCVGYHITLLDNGMSLSKPTVQAIQIVRGLSWCCTPVVVINHCLELSIYFGVHVLQVVLKLAAELLFTNRFATHTNSQISLTHSVDLSQDGMPTALEVSTLAACLPLAMVLNNPDILSEHDPQLQPSKLVSTWLTNFVKPMVGKAEPEHAADVLIGLKQKIDSIRLKLTVSNPSNEGSFGESCTTANVGDMSDVQKASVIRFTVTIVCNLSKYLANGIYTVTGGIPIAVSTVLIDTLRACILLELSHHSLHSAQLRTGLKDALKLCLDSTRRGTDENSQALFTQHVWAEIGSTFKLAASKVSECHQQCEVKKHQCENCKACTTWFGQILQLASHLSHYFVDLAFSCRREILESFQSFVKSGVALVGDEVGAEAVKDWDKLSGGQPLDLGPLGQETEHDVNQSLEVSLRTHYTLTEESCSASSPRLSIDMEDTSPQNEKRSKETASPHTVKVAETKLQHLDSGAMSPHAAKVAETKLQHSNSGATSPHTVKVAETKLQHLDSGAMSPHTAKVAESKHSNSGATSPQIRKNNAKALSAPVQPNELNCDEQLSEPAEYASSRNNKFSEEPKDEGQSSVPSKAAQQIHDQKTELRMRDDVKHDIPKSGDVQQKGLKQVHVQTVKQKAKPKFVRISKPQETYRSLTKQQRERQREKASYGVGVTMYTNVEQSQLPDRFNFTMSSEAALQSATERLPVETERQPVESRRQAGVSEVDHRVKLVKQAGATTTTPEKSSHDETIRVEDKRMSKGGSDCQDQYTDNALDPHESKLDEAQHAEPDTPMEVVSKHENHLNVDSTPIESSEGISPSHSTGALASKRKSSLIRSIHRKVTSKKKARRRLTMDGPNDIAGDQTESECELEATQMVENSTRIESEVVGALDRLVAEARDGLPLEIRQRLLLKLNTVMGELLNPNSK